MGGGSGERIDDLQLLDYRAGPAVRNDERQRIFMFRTNVNEMDIQPIDLSDKLRQGVQSCLALAPIVFCAPIARERLSCRELHALSCICDCFPFRPLCVVDTPAQFSEFRFRDSYFLKRMNRTVAGCLHAAFLYSSSCGHEFLLCGDVESCNRDADRS